MIKKKNSFLTFCFAFLPGAGQMYMGFMNRGISLMSAFFILIFLSSWLNLGPLMFAMPVIWFYAFFDTFNLRGMPDDEFYAMEDKFILFPGVTKEGSKILQSKYRMVLAVALVMIGFVILWNNLYSLFRSILPQPIREIVYRFGHYFPQLLIGFAIILLGIYLIRGKKKELDASNSMPQLDNKGGNI